MKIVVFGLTVSSSWGNGHATLWRGLCGALARRGHDIVFFERDVPYYSSTRDLFSLPGGGELILYSDWAQTVPLAKKHVAEADVALVTSYCADARAASGLLYEYARGLKVFYDLDSPVTLARLADGEPVEYVGPRGFKEFDLVLSYAGGRTLTQISEVLGAKRVAALYGSVDPSVHKPAAADTAFAADMSYLGTYSPDRDQSLTQLFVEPARQLPEKKFALAGSMYGAGFPWLQNIYLVHHLPPAMHPAFYCSSNITLNVTRAPMAAMGYCPSGRLFEASACGVPVMSDSWEGLDTFYTPGSEILLAGNTVEALEILSRPPEELARVGRAARERTLDCHTADKRAEELERILDSARGSSIEAEAGLACGA